VSNQRNLSFDIHSQKEKDTRLDQPGYPSDVSVSECEHSFGQLRTCR
jgi:hypothetical protein